MTLEEVSLVVSGVASVWTLCCMGYAAHASRRIRRMSKELSKMHSEALRRPSPYEEN